MTQTNLQFADHICQRMIANGMVKSQAEFSKLWLDQSSSYLSSSKARQRNIPDAAIQCLFERLDLRMQNYRAQANHMMGIKPWRDAYEKTIPLHVEVQNYLTWKAGDRDTLQLSSKRLDALRHRIALAARKQPTTAPSALSKLIQLATHRKSP